MEPLTLEELQKKVADLEAIIGATFAAIGPGPDVRLDEAVAQVVKNHAAAEADALRWADVAQKHKDAEKAAVQRAEAAEAKLATGEPMLSTALAKLRLIATAHALTLAKYAPGYESDVLKNVHAWLDSPRANEYVSRDAYVALEAGAAALRSALEQARDHIQNHAGSKERRGWALVAAAVEKALASDAGAELLKQKRLADELYISENKRAEMWRDKANEYSALYVSASKREVAVRTAYEGVLAERDSARAAAETALAQAEMVTGHLSDIQAALGDCPPEGHPSAIRIARLRADRDGLRVAVEKQCNEKVQAIGLYGLEHIKVTRLRTALTNLSAALEESEGVSSDTEPCASDCALCTAHAAARAVLDATKPTPTPRNQICHHQTRPDCAGCPDDATCEASGRGPKGTP
jgi:hypothetical protein